MSLIGRFEHLPNRPKSDQARPLLEKIASQVKPIMAKRDWKVGILAEFLPSNPALLGNNMNHGERINLRLRPPGDISGFYEYDQLVLVMLHELTHIEHGPHDAKFYKLLGELEEEYYELKRKGYSGDGFHSSGNHLSGLKVDEYAGRKRGMEAAQKRLDTQKKIGRGGVLGGKSTAGRTMKEVLAEAAERRIKDDKACRSEDAGHAREVEEEVRKAQEESVGVDAGELSGEIGREEVAEGRRSRSASPVEIAALPSHPGPQRIPRTQYPPQSSTKQETPEIELIDPPLQPIKPASKAIKPGPPTTTPPKPNPKPKPASPKITKPPSGNWSCPACTFLNPNLSLQCEVCTTSKPVYESRLRDEEGWYCEFCASGPRDMGLWSCGECGWIRRWG